MTFGSDLTGVGRCPHCQIASPQLKQLWQTDPIWGADNATDRRKWGAYQCTTCGKVTLAEGARSKLVNGNYTVQHNIEKLYPSEKSVDPALPPIAKTYLTQAHQTLHAPDAAAIMAASAVDAMLKDKGYPDGSLYSRIDQSVKDHLLTEGMGKWAHAVRLEANNVRHSDAENPHLTRPQAEQVVEFASALGDFLYVLTSKIDAGVKAAATPPA